MGHSRTGVGSLFTVPAATLLTWLTFALGLTPGTQASAQSLGQFVAAGDSAFAARRAPDALKDYLAALLRDSTDAGVLWRASRAEAELALCDPNTAQADALLSAAERHGRAAVAHGRDDALAHFVLAQALGRIALKLPITGRLPLAAQVHSEVLACLALDPKQAGCLHILGLWDAEYMELGYASKQMADLMGGDLFSGVTWAEAEKNLRTAIALEPWRAIHAYDLARILQRQGKADSARAEFQAVLEAGIHDFNDSTFLAKARAALDSPSPSDSLHAAQPAGCPLSE